MLSPYDMRSLINRVLKSERIAVVIDKVSEQDGDEVVLRCEDMTDSGTVIYSMKVGREVLKNYKLAAEKCRKILDVIRATTRDDWREQLEELGVQVRDCYADHREELDYYDSIDDPREL